uniref:Hedgehog/Intein (Hint) domain-containing protein n=1 Tax=viral metagenome TaxID=1070528 RepID=A0A6C0IJ28_9ZZZZ
MASIFTNVLSNEEVDYLNHLPEVLSAKASLDARSSGMVYFSVPITDSIRAALQSRFGLQLSTDSSIPMRWIKGDTAPHVDVSSSTFENTYLLYLNDSPGELIVNAQSYAIQANTGFVFNEGLPHETQCTEHVPRLLLGPMNEFAQSVGSPLVYFSNEADALSFSNPLGYGGGFVVGSGGPFGPGGGYTSWRLASNSTGTSSKSVVYSNGSTLNPDGSYYLYPSAPCFLEGTTILCQVDGVEHYLPVEQLKNGTLVKTSLDGYKPVVLLGKGTLLNPGNDERTENRLYKCSTSKYPSLKDDLYITGCHSILEFPITEKQKEDTIKHLGKLFVTDKKYRLMACVDERAEPWNAEGTYTIWHFALEHHDESMNYGVYANGGLLVETCCIKTLKNKSNMTLFAE